MKKIIIILITALFLSGCSNSSSYSNKNNYYNNSSSYNTDDKDLQKTISRDEAIDEYWDDIREYVNGSETINACSSESGNCYDLDADISDGVIEQIYFRNSGYLYFSADINQNGSASDSDQDGNNWDFTLDMDSDSVSDAVDDWASDNEYEIE